MATDLKHSYIKVSINNMHDIYIWKGERGYIPTELWVFQQPGWSLYGIGKEWIYFKKPN